jgi:hypothetical protein
MDDDDFNSELLGGLQRQRNLQQNEATRQEIAGLREDLKRKERAEAAAPKCPYCAGTISDGVVKCRHCASDIVWYKVESKQYPIKTGEDPKPYIEKKLKELAEKKRKEESRKENSRRANSRYSALLNKRQEEKVKNNIRFLKCLGLSLPFCILAGIAVAAGDDRLIRSPGSTAGMVLGITVGATIPIAGLFYLISGFKKRP